MDPLTLIIGFGLTIWLLSKAQSSALPGSDAVTASDLGVNMPPIPSRLSPSGIAQVAANAGFQGNDLITAVAIALAESGGNPGVVGDLSLTPGGSVGLWQINLRWHPEYTAAKLVDPQTNANAAFAIYQAAGNSFTPWSTFKNGAYTAHLDEAQSGADVVA